MDSEIEKSMVGSGVANFGLLVVYFLFKFLRERCKKSQCESHTSWYTCTSELEEIKSHTMRANNVNDKQLQILEELHKKITDLEKGTFV